MDGGVNCKVDGVVRMVVDQDKDGGLNNGTFQCLHHSILLLGPSERLALAGEKDKRVGKGGIVANPYVHVASDA